MKNIEKIIRLNELSDRIRRKNISGSNELVRDGEEVISIMVTFETSDEMGSSLWYETTSMGKQLSILKVGANHWSSLIRPRQKEIENFTEIRSKMYNYTIEFIRLCENL
jgi:hypothetical protein